MHLEIQRTAFLSIFFYVFIQAQDFRKTAVNTGDAKPDVDMFAKPDVDPFASMKTGSNAKLSNQKKSQLTVTRTIVKNERKSIGTNNQPVVGGGTFKTSKTATSTVVKSSDGGNTRQGSTSKVTKTVTKDTLVKNKPDTGQQFRTSTETKTVTRRTNKNVLDRTGNIANRGPAASVRKTSKTIVRKSGTTVGSEPINRVTSGATERVTTITRKSNERSGQTTKNVRRTKETADLAKINRNRLDMSRGATSGARKAKTTTVTKTRVTSGGNRATNREISSIGDATGDGIVTRNTKTTITRTSVNSGSDGTMLNNRRTGSTNLNNVMNLRSVTSNAEKITNVAPNSMKGFNTENIFDVERTNMVSTGDNSVTNIETIETVGEEPVYYIRTLYRDQRICDACSSEGSHCFLSHPEDCRKYIRCSPSSIGSGMEALEMNCAFGTFWSELANTCDLAQDVRCQNDKCMDLTVKSYASGLNCRSYWNCVSRRSDAECCPSGKAYIGGECIPDDTCKVADDQCPLRYRKKPEENKQECTLEAVPGNEYAFRMKYGHLDSIMMCAQGTKFDETKCICVKGKFRPVVCRPNADLNFTTEVTNKVNNHVTSENIKFEDRNYGQFNGRAFVSLPFYDSNESYRRNLVIKIRFYHAGQGYDSQVLASNCKTKSGYELSPSFAILLARNSTQIMFFASTKHEDGRRRYGSTATVKLNYIPERWTVVEFRWLNEVLYGKVTSLNKDGTIFKETEGQKPLKGTLQRSVMPLMVGNCNMNDGFVGFIDTVIAYNCDPGLI